VETCQWLTTHHLDPPDLSWHGCYSDWGPAASGGQTVLANNRNGGRLQLIASRHYYYCLSVCVCVCVLAFTKTVRVSGQDYQLELIDTAGQDELSIVSQSHSMNLDGYVLVYSVTSEKRLLTTYLVVVSSSSSCWCSCTPCPEKSGRGCHA